MALTDAPGAQEHHSAGILSATGKSKLLILPKITRMLTRPWLRPKACCMDESDWIVSERCSKLPIWYAGLTWHGHDDSA